MLILLFGHPEMGRFLSGILRGFRCETLSNTCLMISREYSKTRFLIVDQNIKLRMAMEKDLKSFGAWFIDMAADADEAIEKCRQGLFDVVICDYHLGIKNGQQVLEELRHTKLLRYTSLFVQISSDTTKEMVLNAIDNQPDAYITKPVTRTLLKQRLDSLLIDSEILYDIKHARDCGDASLAIALCQEKIRKHTKYRSWCLKTQAELHLEQQAFEEAEACYREALHPRPLVWAKIGIAKVLIEKDDLEQAGQILKEIIRASPNCLPAYDLYVHVLELQNRLKEALEILMTAVDTAPRSVRRQAQLGELCLRNHILDVALESFRNAVELGEYSIYDKASNHIHFAHCLNESSLGTEQALGDTRRHQAMDVLQGAEQRFELKGEDRLHARLVKCRTVNGLNRHDEADALIAEAKMLYMKDWSRIRPDLKLEYAQTLFMLKDDDAAEMVLSQMQMLHAHDKELMQRIEELREEPVSWHARAKAAELNKEGIKMFEDGRIQDAVSILKNALEYSSRHPALNLNLVQVLLKALENETNPIEYLMICHLCLDRLSHLREDHKQFPRYQHLKKKVNKLETTA